MPSLDQIRRWMRGEIIEELPANPPLAKRESQRKKPDIARVRDKRGRSRDGNFTMIGRTDALINFGIHKGSKLSELASNADGRDYMSWMLREQFPDYLKKAVKAQLDK